MLAWAIGGFFALGGVLGGQLHLVVGLLPAVLLQLAARHLKQREFVGGGEARVDDRALHLDGDRRWLSVDRERLRWGAARGKEVDFETREGRRITLVLRRRRDAARLLEATATSVGQRAVVLPLRAQIGPFVTGLLVFIALIGPVSAASVYLMLWLGLPSAQFALMQTFGTPAVCLALSLAFVKHFARPTMTIGIDGILVRRRLRRRFIPYAKIESVALVNPVPAAPKTHGMVTTLRLQLAHEAVDLPIVGWSDEDVRRAITRIEEARAAANDDTVAPATALARGNESVDAWRERLRRLLSADAGFRQRRLTLDETLEILADPGVPLTQRVGAALAAAEVGPKRARKRIRFAAEASADEGVRGALLSTLNDDDSALEAALAEAEQTTASEATSRRRTSG